jgi:hypothetical protein
MKAFFVSCVLLVTPLVPSRALPGPVAPAITDTAAAAAPNRSLFLQLGSNRPYKEARQIEILVQVDGRPFSSETLSVERGKAAGAVLGLLMARPDLRNQVDQWGRSGDRQVVVKVLLEGRELQRLSYKDLVQGDQRIRRASFGVLDAEVTLNVFKPPSPRSPGHLSILTSASCEDACEEDRESCYGETCPGLRSCPECDDLYDACVNSCSPPPPPCTDPKSVSYGTAGPVPVAAYPVGAFECLSYGLPDGDTYEPLLEILRTYTTQTTNYCDGHSSTVTIGYSDSSWYCDYWLGSPCSGATGWPGFTCY